MIVSIVICTFNRSRLLERTLTQMRSLDRSCRSETEILVVNNNCTDDTDEVIRRHSGNLPIRRLWEPRPGKSHAANRAVEAARGDLFLWTDDDVLVDSDWLNAYVEAACRFPRISFFGGAIVPWFELEPPAWLVRHLRMISACYALRDAFDDPFVPINAFHLPFGANMATRRECFEGYSFDTRLGPQPNSEVRGEETALLRTWLERGLQGVWVKGARVRHFIPGARLTRRYIWDFHCGAGRAQVRCGDIPPGNRLFGAPRWAVRRYVQNLVISGLLSGAKSERWLESLITAAICEGIIREFRASRT
jgi:glycosyltransferase involved in cell wall biosynthesis